jgi:acetyl-CoA carboxylase biotin carboxylase subunit
MIHKVLVANRGEIAVRIIRTCREMGLRTVAIYSTMDKDAMHVKMADQAICVGPPPSTESYLNVPSILSAIEITDSDSVHPGYGFLAENPAFAEICENYGVKFIGPSSESIRLMGDKVEARRAVRRVKVPTVPGSDGAITDEEEGLRISKEIGFPVIIKAAAGGGGRGMKIVHSPPSFINAFLTAQSEALSAFGVPDVYIEKYFEHARHVEVQIVADRFRNVIHLGDRDCSVQRRHQKLIEEAQAPFLPARVRAKIHKAAVDAASAVRYNNVGTVEFLYISEGEFYFLEMNTRIQVEHPVTEMITGVDIHHSLHVRLPPRQIGGIRGGPERGDHADAAGSRGDQDRRGENDDRFSQEADDGFGFHRRTFMDEVRGKKGIMDGGPARRSRRHRKEG